MMDPMDQKKARLFWDEEEVRGKNDEKSRREKP